MSIYEVFRNLLAELQFLLLCEDVKSLKTFHKTWHALSHSSSIQTDKIRFIYVQKSSLAKKINRVGRSSFKDE